MKKVLFSLHTTSEKGVLWQSVPNVEKKLVTLPRLGKWLANQTKAVRKPSLQLDSSTIVELLTELSWAKEKSNLRKHYLPLFSILLKIREFASIVC